MVRNKPLPAVPSGVILTRDCTGRYSASFVVAVEREPLPPNSNAVDVAPGLASLAVTRDGVKIAPPLLLHAAFQGLRRLQWSPGRKVKDNNNRTTAHFRRARGHATVVDQRLDLLHKLGTGPIREHQTLCIEHLNGAGMAKNHRLARSMADTAWHLLRTLLAPEPG